MQNRSVPTDGVIPHVMYFDVAAAIEWLTRTFGFTEHFRYGNPDAPDGAQIRHGSSYIMLSSANRPGRTTPASSGLRTQMLTLIVDDIDKHYKSAKASGIKIVEDLNEPIYGERQYVAEDLEGHHWVFSQHVRDADPRDWGAIVAGA